MGNKNDRYGEGAINYDYKSPLVLIGDVIPAYINAILSVTHLIATLIWHTLEHYMLFNKTQCALEVDRSFAYLQRHSLLATTAGEL